MNEFAVIIPTKPAGEGSAPFRANGKVKEALFEWDGQRVLPVTRPETCPVRLVQCLIFDCYVRWISNYDMITLTQECMNLLPIFDVVIVLKRIVI